MARNPQNKNRIIINGTSKRCFHEILNLLPFTAWFTTSSTTQPVTTNAAPKKVTTKRSTNPEPICSPCFSLLRPASKVLHGRHRASWKANPRELLPLCLREAALHHARPVYQHCARCRACPPAASRGASLVKDSLVVDIRVYNHKDQSVHQRTPMVLVVILVDPLFIGEPR